MNIVLGVIKGAVIVIAIAALVLFFSIMSDPYFFR